MRHVVTTLMLTGLLCCQEPEPVLPGIPPEALLAGTSSAEERREQLTEDPPQEIAPAYTRAPGVYLDVHYLGGRSFQESRQEVLEQLGALLSSRALHNEGTEMTFERGIIRVSDEQIYMISVPLPEPLRRSEALQLLGFPPYVDRYITLHREYRLNHEWGFRRIRMKRQDRDSELVTNVEAWRWIPGEHAQHR